MTKTISKTSPIIIIKRKWRWKYQRKFDLWFIVNAQNRTNNLILSEVKYSHELNLSWPKTKNCSFFVNSYLTGPGLMFVIGI